MKIALTGDTHIGITDINIIKRMLLKIKKEKPDIIIHCGDHSGGFNGHGPLRISVELFRSTFSKTPILSVLGNHDYWSTGKYIGKGPHGSVYEKPDEKRFYNNLSLIRSCFKEYNIFFLDEDGVYRDPRFPGLAVVGHTGWYYHDNTTRSNDWFYLPEKMKGSTQDAMARTAYEGLKENLSQLTKEDTTRIFVSHFPVINPGTRGWDPDYYKQLKNKYNIQYFLQGHLHKLHCGPECWESGSDYDKPDYVILEI